MNLKWLFRWIATFAIVRGAWLHAATMIVTNTNDAGAGSLRQAILDAAPGDLINLAASGTITLTSGELLFTKSLAILGPGTANLAVSGNTNSRVFEIGSNVIARISNLTVRDGHASDGGNGSSGGDGGGLYNAGTLTLTGCTFTGNTGGGGGGGGTGADGGRGGHGGGLYNAGTLTLMACTVGGNTGGTGGVGGNADEAGAGGGGGQGGGLYNAGTLTAIACTFSGNGGGTGGRGGSGVGLYALGGAGGNGGSGGGIYNAASASFASLHSTLVAVDSGGAGGPGGAGKQIGSPGSRGAGPDLAGSFASGGYNLIGISDGSAGMTNGINADLAGTTGTPLNPMVGPLGSNGGPTFTIALLPGSPTLDAGDDALLAAPFNLTTDQRGRPRRSGPHVDIGAFETQVDSASFIYPALSSSGMARSSLASPTTPGRASRC